MSYEPFLAFFLVRYLIRSLRTFSPLPSLERTLTIIMYSIVAFFIADVFLHIAYITKWIWYALILFIFILPFKQPDLDRTKPVIYALLPLVIISFIGDILKSVSISYYNRIDGYVQFAFVAAITWMIAMLFRSNKQNKALQKERKKTLEEEERSRFIAAQKDKLEILVAERTAELTSQKEELEHALHELKSTQTLLIQSEKMASLGELTAGIAHEIQNPLNFVNNFSEVNKELLTEMKEEINKGNLEEVKSIADDVIDNEEKINHHGKRADAIVKGMLQHSRSSGGQKEPTDINALADEYLRLAYHGLRAKDKSFNAIIKTDFDTSLEKINIIPQDIGRVILNLITNAFYAVAERKKAAEDGYEPTVSVSTKKSVNQVIVTVSDNGNGIPKNIVDKIFQPFFTTKPTGQGTGLGLSLSYDIIKAHGGELNVETSDGEGAAFNISLSLNML